MKNYLLILICVIITQAALCQSQFEKALEFSKNQQYFQAIEQYKELITKQDLSPELHYNLANNYLHLDSLPMAILHYQKALSLKPHFQNANINLQIAQSKLNPKPETQAKFFITKMYTNICTSIHANSWTIINIFFFLITAGLIIAWKIGSNRKQRKISFYLSLISLSLALFSLSLAKKATHSTFNTKKAVLISSSPLKKNNAIQSPTISKITQGTTVIILREKELDGWLKIKAPNGLSGWIPSQSAIKI